MMSESGEKNEATKPKAMNRLVTKLTKEMLWMYILRLLQERPYYGYEIKQNIKDRFGFTPATVSGYAIIYRLINDGLIKEEQKDDSPRKYYAITEKGRSAMSDAKAFLSKTMTLVFDQTE